MGRQESASKSILGKLFSENENNSFKFILQIFFANFVVLSFRRILIWNSILFQDWKAHLIAF